MNLKLLSEFLYCEWSSLSGILDFSSSETKNNKNVKKVLIQEVEKNSSQQQAKQLKDVDCGVNHHLELSIIQEQKC